MRKRKKPILLVTVLILLVTGAGGYNLYTNIKNRSGEQMPEQAQEPQSTLGESRGKESAADVASQAKAALNSKAGGPKAMRAEMGGPEGPMGMGGPSVVRRQNKPYKPMPNDSSISGQWYAPEHMQEVPKNK